MKLFARGCIAVYTRLLRLYPARFQYEYADEMQSVFEQMVLEHGNSLSLVGLMAGELWDLPASLLREYQYERRLGLQGGSVMAARVIPAKVFWLFIGTLLAACVLYGATVLFPYFYNGLNTVPLDMLTGGGYDPKGYPPFVYDSVIGYASRFLGFIVLVCGPVADVGMGGVLTLTLLRHWRTFQHKQRVWGVAAVLVAASMLALTFSPFGHALFVWFMD